MVSKNSRVPVYWQIKEDIYSQIVSGELKANDQILSETKLAKKYNVSRLTARNAVNTLVNEGYLVRVHGHGTFVKQPRVEVSTDELSGFMEDMQKRGFKVRSKVIKVDKLLAPEELMEILKLNDSDCVYQIKRLRFANEEPIVIQDVFLNADFCPGIIDINLETDSIYRHLREDYNLSRFTAWESLEARNSDEKTAKYLEIQPHDAVLFSKRLTFLENGAPIEYSYSWYRGDRYVFEMSLK